MSLTVDQLYALLPAVYRTKDISNGQPLYALLSVIAAQGAILEENIQQLYDDQFIETCAPWVIPYIGDLVGSNTIYEIEGLSIGRRAEVANTIGYRRRKGTLLALEQVSMDVSGLPALAVEYFKRLITTESMRHIRPKHASFVDLRHGGQLERMGTPFDSLNYTVDVRRIAPRVRTVLSPDPTTLDINLHGPGRFNIPDVGIFLWRWKSFRIDKSPAFPVDALRYLFSPLGQEAPLFNALTPRDSFAGLTTRMDVPQPIHRREFSANIGQFYGENLSISVYLDGAFVDTDRIACQKLGDCSSADFSFIPSGMVAIDPASGRLQLATDLPTPQQVQVSYCYGFPAEIGGGTYNRAPNLPTFTANQFTQTWVIGHGPTQTSTLEAAIAEWNTLPSGSEGLIVLPDYASYDIDLTGANTIALPAQSYLYILAAQLPLAGRTDFSYTESCATLRGDIAVSADAVSAGANPPQPGQLVLSGLWLSGSITISNDAANVQLFDCTLVPGIALTRCGKPTQPGAPSIVCSAAEVNLCLIQCISGPIGAFDGGTTRICTSILDANSRCAVAYAGADLNSDGADLHIEDSTVIGKVWTRTMDLASNTIFLARLTRNDSWKAALWCSRRQAGCVRFCYLPAAAIVPQQFECLPPSPDQENAFRPQFILLRYGHPSYALLSGDTPMAIWTGADNGAEIGVYNPLQETQAVRNVQLRAGEYLPFGLEAGIFLVPSRPIVTVGPPAGYGYTYPFSPPIDPCGQDEDDLRFVGIGAALI